MTRQSVTSISSSGLQSSLSSLDGIRKEGSISPATPPSIPSRRKSGKGNISSLPHHGPSSSTEEDPGNRSNGLIASRTVKPLIRQVSSMQESIGNIYLGPDPLKRLSNERKLIRSRTLAEGSSYLSEATHTIHTSPNVNGPKNITHIQSNNDAKSPPKDTHSSPRSTEKQDIMTSASEKKVFSRQSSIISNAKLVDAEGLMYENHHQDNTTRQNKQNDLFRNTTSSHGRDMGQTMKARQISIMSLRRDSQNSDTRSLNESPNQTVKKFFPSNNRIVSSSLQRQISLEQIHAKQKQHLHLSPRILEEVDAHHLQTACDNRFENQITFTHTNHTNNILSQKEQSELLTSPESRSIGLSTGNSFNRKLPSQGSQSSDQESIGENESPTPYFTLKSRNEKIHFDT